MGHEWYCHGWSDDGSAPGTGPGAQQLLVRLAHQYRRRNAEEAELLSRDYGTRYHPEAVQILVKRFEERRKELSEVEKDQPLYTFAGGDTITAGDFVNRVRELRGTSTVEDHLSFSEDELRVYYDSNREDFRVAETVRIEEVHAKDESTARQFRDEIAGGTPFADILPRNDALSFGKHRLGGTMTLHLHLAGRFPELVEAAFAAQEGELIGPVRLEEQDAYAIFRVLERQENRIEPFEKVRKSVEYNMRTRRNELVSAFIQSLRDKYEGQVAIFDDRLEQRQRDQYGEGAGGGRGGGGQALEGSGS